METTMQSTFCFCFKFKKFIKYYKNIRMLFPKHIVQAYAHMLQLEVVLVAKVTRVICTNIFKCQNEKAFQEEFTKKWIELINQAEKNKNIITKAK